ncbi:MAG: ribosome silencing factor [Prevotella sp.]|nr:ribosome silencing factor [Prevotella sp.]
MNATSQLVTTIIKGIQEKKGQDIIIVDLGGIDGAIANYFIICQGNSPSQVEAITESIGDAVRTESGEKPANVIGLGNDQWVAMDYTDVMVHVFLPDVRTFYDIENLWEDAILTKVPNID